MVRKLKGGKKRPNVPEAQAKERCERVKILIHFLINKIDRIGVAVSKIFSRVIVGGEWIISKFRRTLISNSWK